MGRFCLNQVDVRHKVSRFQHLQLGRLCPSGHIGGRQWISSLEPCQIFLSPGVIEIDQSSLNQVDIGHMVSGFQQAQFHCLCPGGQIGERQWTLSLEHRLGPV